MLLAMEGIDGSGKGTQSKLLFQRCQNDGLRVELLSFPRYDKTAFGKAIGDFLNGRFGSLDEVSPFLAALLYAGDRFESKSVLQNSLDENEIVILDRYVASNIAHQAAKCDAEEREKIVSWIEKIEFEIYNLPKTNLTLLLDLPVEQATELIAHKNRRNYTDKSADLHEADADYLGKVREIYRQLANTRENWQTIDCVKNGELRSKESIAEQIWKTVQPRMA